VLHPRANTGHRQLDRDEDHVQGHEEALLRADAAGRAWRVREHRCDTSSETSRRVRVERRAVRPVVRRSARRPAPRRPVQERGARAVRADHLRAGKQASLRAAARSPAELDELGGDACTCRPSCAAPSGKCRCASRPATCCWLRWGAAPLVQTRGRRAAAVALVCGEGTNARAGGRLRPCVYVGELGGARLHPSYGAADRAQFSAGVQLLPDVARASPPGVAGGVASGRALNGDGRVARLQRRLALSRLLHHVGVIRWCKMGR